MKKIYSYVLMAAALLIGTNAWAKTIKVAQTSGEGIDYTNLVTAFSKAESGDIIQLQTPMSLSSYIWIGDTALASASGNLKELTLDLNGQQLSYSGSDPFLQLTHGKLTIKTSEVGGKIYSNRTGTAAESVILVTGSPLKDCKPKTQTNYYSHLVIENGVEIEGQKNGIVVDGTHAASVKNTLTYTTDVYQSSNQKCVAHGVRVDVYGKVQGDKYAVKVNGLVTKPTEADGVTLRSVNTSSTWASKVPAGYTVAAGDTAYIPYINIAQGSELKVNPSKNESAALMCTGYANYHIAGYVHGSTGVYVKSGNIEVVEGANIKSDNETATGIKSTGKGAGLDAGGNGIAVETNTNSYAGGVNISVTGGTITAGKDGYAIQNVNAENSPEVESVTISGGTFTGGAQGCITIDSDPENPVNVELEGGTFTGDIQTLIAAVADSTNIITQVVEQSAEGATVVIGKKDANDEIEEPKSAAEINDFEFVADMSNDIVKLNAENVDIAKTLPEDVDEVVVKYLSLTGSGEHTSTVTVESGKTLKVGQIVMNANGRLIVEAGATLVVTGANGIFADNIENLVLETEEGNHSSFLLHPSVANNQHPKATVQFISKSYYNSNSDFRNQRFGIPTIGALESIDAEYAGAPVQARIWGYFNGSWDLIGTVNGGSEFDASLMNAPFAYYQMNTNSPDAGSVITMTGNLVGIADPELEVTANNWSTFANSFMADMDAKQMMAMFDGHDNIDATLQTYTPTSENTFAWFPFNYADVLMGEIVKIEPMQAFIIKNNGEADQLQMHYKSMVWDPIYPSNPQTSRRRAAASDMTTARIEVRNAAGVYDYVTLLEDDQFDAEYNNGYDAEKIMNNTLDFYIVGAMNQATLATDNLSNTVLGMNCEEAGTYTISFSHLNGAELTLIDHTTGARVAMVEGSVYEFTAAANTVNDYRFEIVESAKMPTAIENTEAVKSAKGIYTITGQYVGEMNVWNTLPAGIYVVNGEKLVK